MSAHAVHLFSLSAPDICQSSRSIVSTTVLATATHPILSAAPFLNHPMLHMISRIFASPVMPPRPPDCCPALAAVPIHNSLRHGPPGLRPSRNRILDGNSPPHAHMLNALLIPHPQLFVPLKAILLPQALDLFLRMHHHQSLPRYSLRAAFELRFLEFGGRRGRLTIPSSGTAGGLLGGQA